MSLGEGRLGETTEANVIFLENILDYPRTLVNGINAMHDSCVHITKNESYFKVSLSSTSLVLFSIAA